MIADPTEAIAKARREVRDALSAEREAAAKAGDDVEKARRAREERHQRNEDRASQRATEIKANLAEELHQRASSFTSLDPMQAAHLAPLRHYPE